MQKDSKIYVAGHKGLVGSAIVRALSEKGYENIITRDISELNLCRQSDVEVFFEEEKPEYVFLAAAKVGGILANSTYTAEFIYDNIMIATNVIHSAYKSGSKKLLNLGSSCIYPREAEQPLKEDALLTGLLEPTNEPYAIAKIAAIKLCKYYNQQYGTEFISVMPTNQYGPGDNYDLENSHVLPALIRKFHLAKLLKDKDYDAVLADFKRHGKGSFPFEKETAQEIVTFLKEKGITADAVTLWGTGNPRREFMYVDDLASACVFFVENCRVSDLEDFVNVGVGSDLTIAEVANIVKDTVGFDGDIEWDKTKPDGMMRKVLDVSKMRELGFTPRIALEEGVKLAYKAYLHK